MVESEAASGDEVVYAAMFAPCEDIAIELLPYIRGTTDGSHDLAHVLRVWRSILAIHAVEGGDRNILCAAAILHDCVAVEKESRLSDQASKFSAEMAGTILRSKQWTADRIEAVMHAIEAHSFSGGVTPQTLEARILQDADRLDAIGLIGVARTFYIAGRLGKQLYHQHDPRGATRSHDDRRFAIDHFYTKLLRLSANFQTGQGAELARERHSRLEQFLADLLLEL
ncbi:MAG TPA: HD domain-containing protein [Bradyrhizobium sp.]|nr:HD domain-containing protein [Bradyrhizobium sp.]